MTLDYRDFVDPMHLVPVVGYPMSMHEATERYDQGEITFGELALLSAYGGAITGIHLIIGAQHSYLTAMRFQALVTASMNPTTYATIGLVAGVHATMKPAADVSMGPYGSVRVMPRLGIF